VRPLDTRLGAPLSRVARSRADHPASRSGFAIGRWKVDAPLARLTSDASPFRKIPSSLGRSGVTRGPSRNRNVVAVALVVSRTVVSGGVGGVGVIRGPIGTGAE
jgi:hypothetical protein